MNSRHTGSGGWADPGDADGVGSARAGTRDAAAGTDPRVPDPAELGPIALRVARYAGEHELDVLELGFMLQSVPEAAHLRDWIRRRLAPLLGAFAAWPRSAAAPVASSAAPSPCPAAAALVGIAAVLGAVERHHSADAHTVWADAGPHERARIAEGARLALAADGPGLERAWRRAVAVWHASPDAPRP